MGFFSFLGRVLFASFFILSAWQMFNDFGDDGGPAAKEWAPRLAAVQKYLSSKFGEIIPTINVRHFVAASIALEGLGGFLFVFGSPVGAHLLISHLIYTTPLLYPFYQYEFGEPEFLALLQDLLQYVALAGALLFFVGMKNSIPRKQLRKKTPKSKTL